MGGAFACPHPCVTCGAFNSGGIARRPGWVQCLADFAAAAGTATRDAAFPSGGRNTGTINADRIIKIATPTRTSTIVTCQVRFDFVIAAFLSQSPFNSAIQFPDCRETEAFEEGYKRLRINLLGILLKLPAFGRGNDCQSDGIRHSPDDTLRL